MLVKRMQLDSTFAKLYLVLGLFSPCSIMLVLVGVGSLIYGTLLVLWCLFLLILCFPMHDVKKGYSWKLDKIYYYAFALVSGL